MSLPSWGPVSPEVAPELLAVILPILTRGEGTCGPFYNLRAPRCCSPEAVRPLG